MIFFLCTGLVRPRTPLAGDPDEDIKPRTFKISDVWRLVERGQIVDMKTVVGLELVKRGSRR
jgi:hypothetical protein